MQFPCVIIRGNAREIVRYPAQFSGPDGRNHHAEVWALWTADDWSQECPGWRVLPIRDDGPPSDPTETFAPRPLGEWDEAVDALVVTYAATPKTAEQIAAEQEAAAAAEQRAYADAVQAELDRVARLRRYDSIHHAANYRGSKIPRYAAEGQAAADWRDDCWAFVEDYQGRVQRGEVPQPTPAQLVAMLPDPPWTAAAIAAAA